MTRSLRLFAWLWMFGVAVVWVSGAVVGIRRAPTLWSGLGAVAESVAPWNVLSWLITAAFIAPAAGAFWLADRLAARRAGDRV